MLRRMQNVGANFVAIVETSRIVSFNRLRAAWIFDAVRQFGPTAADEVARWAVQLQIRAWSHSVWAATSFPRRP